MAKKALGYTDGVQWLARMERVQEHSVSGLKFSPAVILLGHLHHREPEMVARDVLQWRRTGSLSQPSSGERGHQRAGPG